MDMYVSKRTLVQALHLAELKGVFTQGFSSETSEAVVTSSKSIAVGKLATMRNI